MTSSATLPRALRASAVRPGDKDYPGMRSTYLMQGSPAIVLRPTALDEVRSALSWARTQTGAISVRSGGHGTTSTNDGGTVIDLTALHDVEVIDAGRRLVRVGPGARWSQVAEALQPLGLAITSGDYGGVGVGGLALAGGIGWLTRRDGLTIDRVRSAKLVMADGSVRHVDERDTDLFWALRGAGGSLGIATEFVFEAAPTGDVARARIVLDLDAAGNGVREWSERMTAAPRALTSTMTLFRQGERVLGQVEAVVASSTPFEVERILGDLIQGLPVLQATAQLVQYSDLMPSSHLHANIAQQSGSTGTNGIVLTLTAETAAIVMRTAAASSQPYVQLRALGGAVNDLDAGATAFSARAGQVMVLVNLFSPNAWAALEGLIGPLHPHIIGSYPNFESRLDAPALARAFPGEVGQRLREVQAAVDPDHVFRREPW